MNANFTWTKGMFSGFYNIYSDGNFIGKVEESLSKPSTGWFNGRDYIFKSHGFFRQQVDIIDCSDNSVVGQIVYNDWMSKAYLLIKGQRYTWKYDNIWSTQWSISDPDGNMMSFHGSTTKGQIYSMLDDGLLLLASLFITNYYWHMVLFILLITVFIPIIIL
jgi:hypothetical protein